MVGTRRSAIVTLTPEGKTLFKRMARDHQGWVRDAMKDFPRDKQQQLYDLLADLKVSIGRS